MASVIKAGTAITFDVTPGEGGFPATAHSIDLAVYIDGQMAWGAQDSILWDDAVTNGSVTFPGAASQIQKTHEFALFTLIFIDGNGVPQGQLFNEVIIESTNVLRVLENSFATWGDVQIEAMGLVNLRAYQAAPRELQIAALINAYYSIGDINVNFDPPRSRGRYHDQSHFWDAEGIFEVGLGSVRSTRMLTPEYWDMLTSLQRQKLVRAQLIEANHLLSGNTPEKQRLAGLLSHSAGESAHFYRTSKPLELPICREAALALKGIISYVTRIGG